MVYGCRAPEGPNSDPTSSSRARGSSPPTVSLDARPAALVNGRSLEWVKLRPVMSELAGGEALREVILGMLLESDLDSRGNVITPEHVARERRMLLESLSDDPNVAVRLLEELRTRRRLGPVRFEAMMWRNAALRALVQGQVRIDERALRSTFDLLYGEKRQARLIVVPTLAEADEALKRIALGEPFADVAVERSTDSSAARGGLLEPIARNDPDYPPPLREALWRMVPGQTSDPILLDARYVLLRLEKVIEPDGVHFEDVRAELEPITRRSQERILMERRARSMLANVSVLFFDDSLREGYRSLRAQDASLLEP